MSLKMFHFVIEILDIGPEVYHLQMRAPRGATIINPT
jgi:hypothetical protein